MAYNGFAELGVNVADVSTTPKFRLGDKHLKDGNIYEYVLAAAAIAAGDVLILETGSTSEPFAVKPSTGVSQTVHALAQNAIDNGSYGWVTIAGNVQNVKVAAGGAAGTQLATSSTGATASAVTISGTYTQSELQRLAAMGAGRSLLQLDAESGGLAEVIIR